MGTPNCVARLGVVERRLVAGAAGAHRAPEDAVARLVEARQRAAHGRHPGRRAESGRRTSSSTSSEVTDARSDSLRWMSLAVKPGVSVGTMKPWIGPGPSPSDSPRAHTTATSAMPPLVIHILVPFSTQSSPSRRARVRMLAGSLPESGSVRPKQPMSLARRHAREPLLLLLLGPELPDREHGQRALHRHEAAGARSRRPRARGRPGRRPPRWCRRSRSPRGACRAGRARPSPWPGPSGRCPPRTTRPRRAGRGRRRTGGRCRAAAARRRRAGASTSRKSRASPVPRGGLADGSPGAGSLMPPWSPLRPTGSRSPSTRSARMRSR